LGKAIGFEEWVGMRAVQVKTFGGPEVLVAGELPDPVAGPGQVVVGVVAADVLFVETQIRSGWGGEFFNVQPPYVPGGAVAGRVVSVGDGVDPGWVGRPVVAHTGRAGGGYAERVVVGVDVLIPVPDGLDLRTAAALPHDGATALTLLAGNEIRPDNRVLIVGAGGGMGFLLVQFAHAAGARVIAAARGKRKLDLALELGADAVADYAEPDWTDRVREATGGAGPDLVFDGVGGEIGRAAYEVTAAGGRFSAHGAPSGGFTAIDPADAERRGIQVRGIQHVQLEPAELKRATEEALAEAAAGRIRPVIGQEYPLERAADAHAAIEAREAIGKTLLYLNED
jgi:NADPH2:quinone reductase